MFGFGPHPAQARRLLRARRAAAWIALAASALALASCAPGMTVDTVVRLELEVVPVRSGVIYVVHVPPERPGRGIVVRPATGPSFRIPPGHYPPPGSCRIWRPERPPGQQEPPGPCHELDRRVPPGAYLVYG